MGFTRRPGRIAFKLRLLEQRKRRRMRKDWKKGESRSKRTRKTETGEMKFLLMAVI